MMPWPARGLSLFVQTVLLLGMALLVAQIIATVAIISLPPPRPDITPLSQIAAQLTNPPRNLPEGLIVERTTQAPVAPAGLVERDHINALLARYLGTQPKNVRVWFDPKDQPDDFLSDSGGGARFPGREPVFVGQVEASWFDGSAWTTTRVLPSRHLNPWQRRVALLIAVQLLFLLPLAWFFARRLTRPIRGFADAADRFGRGEAVGSVPEEGPLELRSAARALNQMQARIESYLRERTAMIGAIAHDLRTPLARIAFRIEEVPDEIREKVQADIADMQQMIGDTIAFVRGSSGPYRSEPLDLRDIATSVAASFAEAGHRVELETGDQALDFEGDHLALERMLANLVSNAVAFGKTVEVSASSSPAGPVLVVKDDGPGIPADEIERMFDAFERGDPSRNRQSGGVGLGLSIARSIARAHGADIVLRNRETGGLEAEVTFPASAPRKPLK